MDISRHAAAHRDGDLKSGKGVLNAPQSGVPDHARYGFNSRFGTEKGPNPEELMADVHTGCFTMALSAKLGEAGFVPVAIDTQAGVALSLEGGPSIASITPQTHATVPGSEADVFHAIAADGKRNCPASRVLAAVPIALDAVLAG